MAYRPEMFGHAIGGFQGCPIQWNHAKCGTDPCCHGNDIWARLGDPVAYRLVVKSAHHCQLTITFALSSAVSEILRVFKFCTLTLSYTFPYPTPVSAKIRGCSLWSTSAMLGSAESEDPRLIS